MMIQIRNAELEARLKKQLEATGCSSVEELLQRLLEKPGRAGPVAGRLAAGGCPLMVLAASRSAEQAGGGLFYA